MTRDEREALVAQLIFHEGERLTPYQDTVGKWTIGVGRNLTDRGISVHTSRQMLDEDITECETDLYTFGWYQALTPLRQRVLLDMRFNLGPSRFRQFKNTLGAVARGDYEAASRGMLASKWAKQVGARAVRLAEWMRRGTVA